MNTILKTAIFVTALLCSAAAPPMRLPLKNKPFRMRSVPGTEQTNSMIGREPLFMERSAPVEQLFRMVHGSKGYTKDQLKSIWY